MKNGSARRFTSIPAWGLVMLFPWFALAADPQPGKKLIEFGWDEPDAAYLRRHIAEMEQTPFDGCVFHLNYPNAEGDMGVFTWECWGRRAFTETELAAAREDLKNTSFTRFTENFLRFNTTPGDVDWFDDFGPILNNARLAAKIAREGHCRGILFDVEQYHQQLFDYSKQRDVGRKSWEQYAAQARQRGREVMEAFQDEFPQVVIFLTFGHTLPYKQAKGDPSTLPQVSYGLLAPFLDGMIEAAADGVTLVDGYELSYAYKEPQQFAQAYQIMSDKVLPFVANPEKYKQVMSFGFGIWMDQDWRNKGWNTDDPQKNYFSPQALESAVRSALHQSDRYVWIYSETPRWWADDGVHRVKLPPAYEQALRAAGQDH